MQRSANSNAPGLIRALGLWSAIAVIVGSMIGQAVFLVASDMARELGSPTRVLVVWIIGGIVVLFGAFCYAELGAAIPKAGGDYVYLSRGLSPTLGFLYGWTASIIIRPAMAAVMAAGLLRFTGFLLPSEIDCKMQSNSHYMLWASTCAIAASVVLLTSCSVFQPVIDVVPVGSLEQGVVFYLGDTFRQRQEFTVTAVTVLEKQSDGSRRAIWILEGGQEGGQRLRYITYGAKYPDLKESKRPLRLRRGKRYEVFVYTSTGGKPVDVFAFRVDENGNVRQVPWLII